MLSKNFICSSSIRIKDCSSGIAVKYVELMSLGRISEADALWNSINYLMWLAQELDEYVANPVINYDTVVFSSKGRFAFEKYKNSVSLPKASVHPDEVNCIKQDELCALIDTMYKHCSTC
jgi:hypothetical protein